MRIEESMVIIKEIVSVRQIGTQLLTVHPTLETVILHVSHVPVLTKVHTPTTVPSVWTIHTGLSTETVPAIPAGTQI